jgi:hypothetical protein
MVGLADAENEAWVLSTDEGRALLAEAAHVKDPGPAELERWRKRATSERVSAAIRLAFARRRGAAKFSRADRMWLDRTGLEQATSEPVARHKAERFQGQAERVVDLCCGIGGDTVALASSAPVIAVDLDQGMCRRTRWNAAVYEVADRVDVVRGRAETTAIPRGAWVHIDPDRRASGFKRAMRMSGYEPGIPFLNDLTRSIPGGAIKLGPASDFGDHFDRGDLEIELVSLNGECKEATVWFGALATCRRRATTLPSGATWTERDGPTYSLDSGGLEQSWVFDPDPALIRAGLVDAFGLAHGLARIKPGVDFLAGPKRIDSPFLAAFEIITVVPLDLKVIRRTLIERGLGLTGFKVRGLPSWNENDWRGLPTASRDRMPATILVAGGQDHVKAVVARRDKRDDDADDPTT